MIQNETTEKNIFVEHLDNYDSVCDLFQIRGRELRSFRNKEGQYLDITLGDSTGEIEGKLWDVNNPDSITEQLLPGQIVRVRARVGSYRDNLQLTLDSQPEIIPEGGYTLRDFLPHTDADVNALIGELTTAIDEVENPYLKALLRSIFDNPDLAHAFYEAPAAKTNHHAYIGGLLEHTVNVLQIVQTFAAIYPVNNDLLIAGALLHDIGKIVEYNVTTHIDVSLEGRLLGHTMLGVHIIREHTAGIEGFPEDLLVALQHMLLSHHGNLEWGAPRRPKILEAQLLHFADLTDSRAAMFTQAAKEDEPWVWVQSLGRKVAGRGGSVTL